MQTIQKNKLKPKLLEYMRYVEKTQIPIIITDHNRPVLQIIPYKTKKSPRDVFKQLQGQVKYHENILASHPQEWGDLA